MTNACLDEVPDGLVQASGSAAVQHADLGLAGKDFPLVKSTCIKP